jgi:hypothetical protein
MEGDTVMDEFDRIIEGETVQGGTPLPHQEAVDFAVETEQLIPMRAMSRAQAARAEAVMEASVALQRNAMQAKIDVGELLATADYILDGRDEFRVVDE